MSSFDEYMDIKKEVVVIMNSGEANAKEKAIEILMVKGKTKADESNKNIINHLLQSRII